MSACSPFAHPTEAIGKGMRALYFVIYTEKEETEIEMLRSILAQLEFTHVVRQYHEDGIPFRAHLYVPEKHPETKSTFMEREDEGHVLKV